MREIPEIKLAFNENPKKGVEKECYQEIRRYLSNE
jgi:hypothetical protein